MEKLSFGLSLSNRAVLFGTPFDSLLNAAKLADKSSLFGSVWVGDNLLSKPRLEAITTLASFASVTSNVRLGTICFASFPMRNPLLFAIQWASLDLISKGRTDLSVCIGGAASLGPQFAAELQNMGIKSVERVDRMKEGIELLRRFWSEESVSFNGKYYQYSDVNALPKPIQSDMPIYIAVNPLSNAKPGVEEKAMKRVATIADGWQSDVTPAKTFERRWNMIRDFAQEIGRSDRMRKSMVHLMVNINDDPNEARREAVAFFENYYGLGIVTDEMINHWLAYGTPEDVAEKIGEFVDAGCTTPVLRFVSPKPMKQLQRCIDDVLPQFKSKL